MSWARTCSHNHMLKHTQTHATKLSLIHTWTPDSVFIYQCRHAHTHTHTLQLLLHVSALRVPGPSVQTLSTSPLMENRSPFTSLFHILAAALPISFTAVTIALTDGRAQRCMATMQGIQTLPNILRGSAGIRAAHLRSRQCTSVTGRQVCGLKARGRFVGLDVNDTSKDMSIFFPVERTEDWKKNH